MLRSFSRFFSLAIIGLVSAPNIFFSVQALGATKTTYASGVSDKTAICGYSVPVANVMVISHNMDGGPATLEEFNQINLPEPGKGREIVCATPNGLAAVIILNDDEKILGPYASASAAILTRAP